MKKLQGWDLILQVGTLLYSMQRADPTCSSSSSSSCRFLVLLGLESILQPSRGFAVLRPFCPSSVISEVGVSLSEARRRSWGGRADKVAESCGLRRRGALLWFFASFAVSQWRYFTATSLPLPPTGELPARAASSQWFVGVCGKWWH